MQQCIDKSILLMSNQIEVEKTFFIGRPFTEYQKVYFSTNENINAYLEYVNFENKDKALSVLGSGDQSLNLINKGIKEIDTFDTNKISEYFVFGLRFAMILKYNYKEYLTTLSKFLNDKTTLEEITTIINDLLPYMDKKYRIYWKAINEYNYKFQTERKTNINITYLLTLGSEEIDNIIFKNNYLKDETSYENLRSKLLKANISFKNIDAINLPKIYNSKYDIILMSNIFDYMDKEFGSMYEYKDAEEYINSLKNMLNNDGDLFLSYIFRYSTDWYTRKKIFKSSNIELSDIKNARIEKVESDSRSKIGKDGILILKKK